MNGFVRTGGKHSRASLSHQQISISEHRQWIPLRATGVAILLAWLLAACTVVPINQPGTAAAPGQGGNFNAGSYVESIWASKVVPTVTSKAVDLTTLLPALQKDPQAAGQKYGLALNGSDHFMVKGQGKVTKVDTSGPNGLATVDLGHGLPPVMIQIGPLILGESLRDAVGFINFNDFTNQIDYGAVSQALNQKSAKDVVGKIDLKTLQGKTISFVGTFTYTDPQQVTITPVKIDVTG